MEDLEQQISSMQADLAKAQAAGAAAAHESHSLATPSPHPDGSTTPRTSNSVVPPATSSCGGSARSSFTGAADDPMCRQLLDSCSDYRAASKAWALRSKLGELTCRRCRLLREQQEGCSFSQLLDSLAQPLAGEDERLKQLQAQLAEARAQVGTRQLLQACCC